MKNLKLQIRTKTGWLNLGEVRLLEDESLGLEAKTEFSYDVDYALEFAEKIHNQAASCLIPVIIEPKELNSWPPFLVDLFPQGAALRYVVEHYKIADRKENYWQILSIAKLNPPGNIRVVVDNAASVKKLNHKGFEKSEVIAKGPDFVEYMVATGAPVAGTTGAGGAAPKFLLREDEKGRFHADGVLDDSKTKRCWLVKFPRGNHSSDRTILFAEKIYFDIATEIGLDTRDPLEWYDDCLFIPRFDRKIKSKKIEYLGLESFYSIVGHAGFGSRFIHTTYLDAILDYSSEPETDFIEYCLRDLLNQMMGNTDNHGRNQSMLKSEDWTRLAPLYDFAPMKFDREGIVRSTRWPDEIEQGDIEALSKMLFKEYELSPKIWVKNLKSFGDKTRGLESMMLNKGISEDFVNGTSADRNRLQKSIELYCEKHK